MDNPSESESINTISGKHLKTIAEQQVIIAEQKKANRISSHKTGVF